MTDIITEEKAVTYEDQLPDKAGQRKLFAECPFCGEISKAFATEDHLTFIGGCRHFDNSKANIVQANFTRTYKKED